MYRPYKKPLEAAFPDIVVPKPYISKITVGIARLIARLYLCPFIGTARLSIHGSEELFQSLNRAFSKRSRCILAFRHQNGCEPQILGWFVLFKSKKLARRAGIHFPRRPHLIFVHGYEVLRWGGKVAQAVLPRLGALQIYHAKIDSEGVRRLNQTLMDGPYPLTIAPEGQVSYFTDYIPHLESGAIRIGLNVAEHLGAEIPVELLPVSVLFRYGKTGQRRMEMMLRLIEQRAGLKNTGLPFDKRLEQCRDKVLSVNEKRYALTPTASNSLEERLDALTEAALTRTEEILGVKKEGTPFARMYALRQICWDRIFIPGIYNLSTLNKLERSVADLQAGEAWYAGRHLELVDFICYFKVPIPKEDAPLRSKVEYVQQLGDFMNRTRGGVFADRKTIKPAEIVISTAPSLNLSRRLDEYRRDKKTTIASILDELKEAYRSQI
ncbi:MAG: acyltransferase [Spirochaetaceae bacterium]|jgi:hypothetical protein|nr:acyltransferase [Spirochaetaceae bacterium]